MTEIQIRDDLERWADEAGRMVPETTAASVIERCEMGPDLEGRRRRRRRWSFGAAAGVAAAAVVAAAIVYAGPASSDPPDAVELAQVTVNGRSGGTASSGWQKADWVEDYLPNMAVAADRVELGRLRRSEPFGNGQVRRIVRAEVTDVDHGVAIHTEAFDEVVDWNTPTPEGIVRSETALLTFEVTDPLGGSLEPGEVVEAHVALLAPEAAAHRLLRELSDVVIIFDHDLQGEWHSIVRRIAPVLADGSIQRDPAADLPWRFDTIEQLSDFASGPGETIVIADPLGNAPAWMVLERIPNDELEGSDIPDRDPWKPR